MNVYELIGRLMLLHQGCEDLFSLCGKELDSIIEDTKNDDENVDCDNYLMRMSSYLESLKVSLDEYTSVINKHIAQNIVENSESS